MAKKIKNKKIKNGSIKLFCVLVENIVSNIF